MIGAGGKVNLTPDRPYQKKERLRILQALTKEQFNRIIAN